MIILGLGSNQSDRMAHLRAAVAELARVLSNLRVSSVYESAALLPEGAPPEWNIPYYNMAVCGQADIAPEALLAEVKAIEQKLGREFRGVWGPREIDIDILAMGDVQVKTETLTIPHAGLLERDFAYVPLVEIAPEWKHPSGKEIPRGQLKKVGSL
jgi:2-amino-4-hydroxy-6-hydroxymethyldihydropteridine diphosphokinase